VADYAASYCERCGTRFTFGTSSSVGAPLRDARVLAKGLKHFVLSNSGSIGDAMAYARNDVQSSESLRVTQLFHKTFNFCMTCRQYACDNCWNEAQGACLSCAPDSAISPMEPTDLLLVRTPVSRLEPGPDGSPPRLGDPIGPTSTRPEMPVWPVQDTLIADAVASDGDGRAAAAASGAESARQANRSLWPIQDDLDAERLDLTPEELALVEGQLEHMAPHMLADSTDASTSDEAPEPASPNELSLTAVEPEPAPAPFTAQEDVTAIGPGPEPEPAPAQFTAQEDVTAVEPEPEPAPALFTAQEDVTAVEPAPEPAPAPAPFTAQEDVTAAEPEPAPAPFTPQEDLTAAEPDRIAAKVEPARAESLVEGNVQPWPDATPWSVRPIQSRGHVVGPILVEQAGPPADAVAAQPPTAADSTAAAEVPVSSSQESQAAEWDATADLRAEPEAAAEPEPVFAAEPEAAAQAEPPSLPQWSGLPDWPSDTAWELFSATPDEATEPVAEAPQAASPIESQPTEPVAMPAAPVQQPLDVPTTSVDRWAAAAPALTTEAGRTSSDLPAAWPPIGASWPVPEAPRAPWPGPEASPLPAAIVAAQQAAKQAGPAIWATSSQEVISHGNVRACHHCALPVSTHARFCRRCGTQQG
jgi:hypothetical protein